MSLRSRVFTGVVVLGMVGSTISHAQAQTLAWSNIITALKTGLKPSVVQAQLGDRCVSAEPTAAEYRDLIAELSRDLTPSDQVSFISELQCVTQSPSDTVEVDVSSLVTLRRRGAPLAIQSDDPSDQVTVNNDVIGRVPQTLDLTPGPTYRIRIGEGADARDTLISVRPRWAVSLRKTRTVVDIPGPPVPTLAELQQLLEIGGTLPELPVVPPNPAMPRRPSRGATLLLALAAGGGAFAASAGPCQSMATAPAPDGGSFGGTYYAPGTLVAQVKTACSGAAAGGAFLGTAMLASFIKRAAYRSATSARETAMEEIARLSVQRANLQRQRQMSLDSALAERKRLAFRREVTVALAGSERQQEASPFEIAGEAALQGTATRLQLRTTVAPNEVSWSSSADSIASVDSLGLVRFLRPGEVIVRGVHEGKVVQQAFTVVQRLTRGTSRVVPGILESGDVVDFAFWGTPNQSLRVETFGGGEGGDADLFLFRPNADPRTGGEFCSSTNSTSTERCPITIPAEGAGLWRIRIETFVGSVRGLRIRIQ